MDFTRAMLVANQGFFVFRDPFVRVTSDGTGGLVCFDHGALLEFDPSPEDESATDWSQQ